MIQLSPQDSQFLYMEGDQNLSNTTCVNIYAKPRKYSKGTLYETVVAHLESRLHTSTIFKRKIVRVPLNLDFPYWVDDDHFYLKSHIHRHKLPEDKTWADFTSLVGKIHSSPLDMRRPLWEMHIVENVGGVADYPEGSFALVTKIHHAAVDGASAMKFFACLSDLDAKGTPATDLSEQAPPAGAPPASSEMWKRCLDNHIKMPIKLVDSLWRSTPTLLPTAIKALSPSDEDEEKAAVPKTRFNKAVSPHKVFDTVEFELSDFKDIQKSVEGAKINDVVLAVCSGALRDFLQNNDELPDESLVAWVPINARPTGQKGNDTDGNHVTAMAANLGTAVEDPIERLREITRQTQLSKAGKTGVAARLMTDTTKHLPGVTLALASKFVMESPAAAKVCNLSITNVPGPQAPFYLAGAKCLHTYGMTPLGAWMGLFFVVLSYNGKLTISITSTESAVPDTQALCDSLRKSLTELKNASDKLH